MAAEPLAIGTPPPSEKPSPSKASPVLAAVADAEIADFLKSAGLPVWRHSNWWRSMMIRLEIRARIKRLSSAPRRSLSAVAYVVGRKYPWLQGRGACQAMLQARWEDIEYFDDSWRQRISQMADFIPANATVMDLGCGREWLREIVGPENYTGVDYRRRGEGTVICDFNKGQFPDLRRDVAFVSGCLEYVTDHRWFIAQICEKVDMCIISYCPIETHRDLVARRRVGWVNDLTIDEIKREFGEHRFNLSTETVTLRNAILVFKRG
jgi:hypothetical protein